MRRVGVPACLVAAVAAGTLGSACGDDDDSGEGAEVIVSAAASLEPAFTAYAEVAGIDAKAPA